MNVSIVTISRWECDKVYPSWTWQPKIIAYLGYDPFTNPTLGRPLGNETIDVAFLASKAPINFGETLTKKRLEMRKTRKNIAKDLGVAVKTVKNWETNRRMPCANSIARLKSIFDISPKGPR